MSNQPKPQREVADVLKDLRLTTVQDDDGLALYPVLFDLLNPRYKDGKLTRLGGRLSIKADSGVWRISLECPSEEVACTLVVRSLHECLGELEVAIMQKTVFWDQSWSKRKKDLKALAEPVQ